MVEPQIALKFYAFVGFVIFIFLAIILYVFYGNFSVSMLLLFLTFLLLAIISRSSRWLLERDEYKADIYSATRLRDIYAISHPSSIVNTTLGALEIIKMKLTFFEKLAFVIAGDYHPSDEDRVQTIRNKVDNHS